MLVVYSQWVSYQWDLTSSGVSFSLNGIIFSGVPSLICLMIFSSVTSACQAASVKSRASSPTPRSVGLPSVPWQVLQWVIYNFLASISAAFETGMPEKKVTKPVTTANEVATKIPFLYIFFSPYKNDKYYCCDIQKSEI